MTDRVERSGKRLHARLREAERLRAEFGPITLREAAIFSFGKGIGYVDGYNTASRQAPLKRKADA